MKELKHQSLLYLCYVVMHSDGVVQNQENTLLDQIISIENIPKKVLDQFYHDIKKKSLKEIRKIGLEALINIPRKDQIMTLAWIHKMMYADNEVNIKEAQFLMQTFKPTDISYMELEKAAEGLPDI